MIVTDMVALRKPCKSVSIFEAAPIIKQLENALATSTIKGVGLSANQIGIDARVCIIRTPNLSLDLVNPVVVGYDLGSFDGDGCLSVPGVFITTQRYAEVFVKDSLHTAGLIATGLEAVIIQHETDHTLGILMLDRQIKIPFRKEQCWCGSGKQYKDCHLRRIIR